MKKLGNRCELKVRANRLPIIGGLSIVCSVVFRYSWNNFSSSASSWLLTRNPLLFAVGRKEKLLRSEVNGGLNSRHALAIILVDVFFLDLPEEFAQGIRLHLICRRKRPQKSSRSIAYATLAAAINHIRTQFLATLCLA